MMSTTSRLLRGIRTRLMVEPFSHERPFLAVTRTYDSVHRLLPIILLIMSYFAFLQVWHRTNIGNSALSPGPFFYIQYMNDFVYLVLRWIPAPLLLFSAFFSRVRWLRVLALFTFVQQGALVNALDVNENQYSPSIWLAVALMFLPEGPKQGTRLQKMSFITHFWFSMIVFSFAYAMAGFWKVAWGCVYQGLTDNLGFWNFNSFTYTINEYLLRTGTFGRYPVAEWVAEYPLLGWAMLLAGTYAEAVIWIVFFRPSLWKTFGTLMVFLHFGSKLTLNIGFEAQYLMTGVLFFLSPFAIEKDFWKTMSELPIVLGLRRLKAKAIRGQVV